MSDRLSALVLVAVLLVSCSKTAERPYYTLRTFGVWSVGEAKTCLFGKDLYNAPCFRGEGVTTSLSEACATAWPEAVQSFPRRSQGEHTLRA
jgi:hypothetical protein